MTDMTLHQESNLSTKESGCLHAVIFKETLPRDSKWYCRECFTEIEDRAGYE